MKKYIMTAFAALIAAVSCTNLDEEVYSQMPKEDYLADQSLLSRYTARPYTLLQKWGVEQSMWTLVMQLSNEVAVPKSWDGHWSETRYGELQRHSIDPGNKLIREAWDFCFNGIAACNDVIYEVENLGGDNINSTLQQIISETKILRALYYYYAVDCWGNVPYSVNKAETSYPEQKDRAFFFTFIENEIKDNIAYVPEYSATTYGRVTKDMANFLLAKLYMSSKDWTGTPKWEEAENVAKAIIDGGHFRLANVYNDNFKVHNEDSPEAIFAIPYSSVYTAEAFYPFALTLNDDLIGLWKIGAAWNGTFMGQPDFMATYDAVDNRKAQTWLFGQVYDSDGNKWKYQDGVDENTREPILKDYILNDVTLEGGYEQLKRTDGARIIKWTYQDDGMLTSYKISMENDFILFRYSDVVLMYVESLLRQNKTAEAATVQEFKDIRTRAGLAPIDAADLDLNTTFFNERMHEMAIEGWERQDLIRFEKYLDAWWAKADETSDTYKLLLPIPSERKAANPKIEQNPGYTK